MIDLTDKEHIRLIRRIDRAYNRKVRRAERKKQMRGKKALAVVLSGAGVSTVFCAIGLAFLGIAGTAMLAVGGICTFAGAYIGLKTEDGAK